MKIKVARSSRICPPFAFAHVPQNPLVASPPRYVLDMDIHCHRDMLTEAQCRVDRRYISPPSQEAKFVPPHQQFHSCSAVTCCPTSQLAKAGDSGSLALLPAPSHPVGDQGGFNIVLERLR